MSTLKTPFKYDFVGSFLRPQVLKGAKANYAAGKIEKAEYDEIVNSQITKLVAKQKELGTRGYGKRRSLQRRACQA